MKKLLFITGTRADFGKLEPLASSAKLAGFKIKGMVDFDDDSLLTAKKNNISKNILNKEDSKLIEIIF